MSDQLSESTKAELIRALMASHRASLSNDSDDTVAKLKKAFAAYTCAQGRFTPGDLVTWKDGLRNKKKPAGGEPCIVFQHLETPVIDTENGSGSVYFREPLDLVVGFFDDDDDLVLVHCDSHRFEIYKEA